MHPQTIGSAMQRPAAPARPELNSWFPGKYLSVTSFKRDGSGVATPVWFVIENGRLLVKTDAESFKVKRVRRNAAVMIAPCTASGRLRGEPMPARAEVLPQSDIDHVDQLMARKYRVDKVLILPLYRAVQRLRGAHAETAGVALAITPNPAASNPRSSEEARPTELAPADLNALSSLHFDPTSAVVSDCRPGERALWEGQQ